MEQQADTHSTASQVVQQLCIVRRTAIPRFDFDYDNTVDQQVGAETADQAAVIVHGNRSFSPRLKPKLAAFDLEGPDVYVLRQLRLQTVVNRAEGTNYPLCQIPMNGQFIFGHASA